MENHENQNQDAQPTRAEARAASTESKRISFSITPDLFNALAQRYNVQTERELADALRLGFYKQLGVARPATKQEIKIQEKIEKLRAELEELAAK